MQTFYANGINPQLREEVLYEAHPCVWQLEKKDFTEVPDHAALAFPCSRFAQKISVVYDVRIPLLLILWYVTLITRISSLVQFTISLTRDK